MQTLPYLQIGGHWYRLELKDAWQVTDAGGQGDSHCQKTHIRVATLTIDNEPRTVSDVEEVLIHEILHQIDVVWKCDIDEDNIERLSQGLLQVLKQFGVSLVWS